MVATRQKKKMVVKKKNIRLINWDKVINFTSLLIAGISLIISLIALKIAQKTFLYSSKDYIPDISFSILNNEQIRIINQSNDLYNIDYINILKFKNLGFENYENRTIVEFSFIEKSKMFSWIEDDLENGDLLLNLNAPTPCAYNCQYDSIMIENIKNRIDSIYSFDSKKGYALPSLQGHSYIVEIVYTDKFLDRKSIIFLNEFILGYGYDKIKIDDKTLNQMVNKSNLPKFKNASKALDYIIKNYSEKIDK